MATLSLPSGPFWPITVTRQTSSICVFVCKSRSTLHTVQARSSHETPRSPPYRTFNKTSAYFFLLTTYPQYFFSLTTSITYLLPPYFIHSYTVFTPPLSFHFQCNLHISFELCVQLVLSQHLDSLPLPEPVLIQNQFIAICFLLLPIISFIFLLLPCPLKTIIQTHTIDIPLILHPIPLFYHLKNPQPNPLLYESFLLFPLILLTIIIAQTVLLSIPDIYPVSPLPVASISTHVMDQVSKNDALIHLAVLPPIQVILLQPTVRSKLPGERPLNLQERLSLMQVNYGGHLLIGLNICGQA